MSELTHYQQPTTSHDLTTDPTGGRLIAWAHAAQAANQLAKALSTTTFVPQQMRNVGDATAAILAGDEVGLSPLAALRSIYVVHGTPAFYARTMVALALANGHEIWTEETSDQKVTVKGRRKGSDKIEAATWTIQRAQKAGYTNNKKYATNPQEMLYSKAAAEVARKVAADVLAGMPYSVEDIELEEAPTTTVTREATVEPRKVARKRKAAPEPTEPEFDNPEPPAEPEPTPQRFAGAGEPITQQQGKKLHALVNDLGLTRDQKLAGVSRVIGRDVASTSELTKAEAAHVIDSLEDRLSQQQAAQTTQDTLGAEPLDGDVEWPPVTEPGGAA